MIERTYTTAEAAEMMGVSKQTIYRYISSGTLKSKKVGKCNRIAESQIAELLGTKCTVFDDQEKPVDNVVAMNPAEEKEAICRLLKPVLQATRHYSDLVQLEYEKRSNRLEVVKALFESGETVSINVSGDSGVSMIKDILRGLVYASDDGGLLRRQL